MLPYKHNYGQRITTDARKVSCDRAFLAHYHIDGENAPNADPDGVATIVLGSKTQEIKDDIVSPAVPRNLTVVANVSGVTGTVTITGTNFADEEIEEDFILNGQTADTGDLAFKTITKIEVPAQSHTPAKQTETIRITNGCTGTSGNITVRVTATTLLGTASPRDVTVALTTTDHGTAALVAAAIVDALNADEKIKDVFVASVTGESDANDTVLLETKEYAANDSTLAFSITAGSTGVTNGSSTNGTSGVPEDKVLVGWGKKFGLPYKLYADELVILKLVNKAKEATEGTVAPDADALAKNVFEPNTSSLGTDIDLYIIV